MIEFGDLAGPAEFWIGNTHPATSDEQVKQVLMKCSGDLHIDNFTVSDIRCLTKGDDPRSKSWKVTVPSSCKDAMLNPAMYYKGWHHRPFHPQRKAPDRVADSVSPGFVAAGKVWVGATGGASLTN